MPTYVCLLRFTDQGARAIKKSTARAGAFAKAAARKGVNVESQLWTTGAYDGVLVLSADDEIPILHWLAELTAAGNVRTESMRAFDASQFGKISGR